jgi:hypothetical protein
MAHNAIDVPTKQSRGRTIDPIIPAQNAIQLHQIVKAGDKVRALLT